MALALAVAGMASTASADDSDIDQLVEAAAPDVVAAAVAPLESAESATLRLAAVQVEIPKSIGDGVSIETPFGPVEVALPNASQATFVPTDDDSVAFDNGDGSSTALYASGESTVTFVSILKGPDAPSEYVYTYSGFDELRQDPTDGGVTIWDEGVNVGYFSLPWAKDAAGVDVPTWYEVIGNTLTQVVDHGSGDYAYPIVADPTQNLGGNSYYSNITLDIDMTAATTIVRVTPAPGHNWVTMPRSTGVNAYNALVPSAYEANKYHDQLVCHWANAGYLKVPWNVDSWRPDVGYPATVLAACNP
jgi:hypothetical protein